jgi:zinc transport system substrate-binding protein
MVHRFLSVALISLFMLCILPSAFARERLPVFVSIVPQQFIVQQIGKDLVVVKVMVEPGASPHTYEPKPRQMADLSKAAAYFAIGVEFEKVWLKKITAANPNLKVVRTDQGIEKIAMAAHHHEDAEAHEEADEHHAEEAQGHADDHEQGVRDPHIWLSPPLVKKQAETILAALQEIDPAHARVYETNYRQFVAAIDELDAELKALFAGKEGLQFMVFHPAWGYFAHAYGLKQVPVEIEGKDPKPAQLEALIKRAKKEGVRVIFAQPQFSTRSADLIAREIGGQVTFADPLAEDWMANLREVAAKFKAVLK